MKNPAQTIDRVLNIFETVALEGPISLKVIVEKTQIPRSAVHRSLQNLQSLGWIRARLHDHSYEVTSHFDNIMANSHSALSQSEEFEETLKQVRNLGCHADLAIFRGRGKFETIESTDKQAIIGARHSLVTSTLSIVALRQLTPVLRIRHLQAFLKEATPHETNMIKSGQIAQKLASSEPTVPLISSLGVSVALPDNNEQGTSMLIRPIPGDKSSYEALVEQSQSVTALFEYIGTSVTSKE
jgi:DNA-binding IclR family transcriptional regulator